MANRGAIDILLSCEHTIIVSNPVPDKGEEQYCRYCQDWKYVGIVNREEYWAYCWDCKWRRRYGQDEYTAKQSAKRHSEKTGHDAILKRRGV